MAKAKVTNDEFDSLPGDLQSEYSQPDGADFHVLTVTPVDGMELMNPGTLKSSLQTERKRASTFETQVKTLTETFDGIDAAAARDALSKIGEMDDWDPEKKLAEHKTAFELQVATRYDGEKKKLVEKHAKDSEGHTTQLSIVTKQLRTELIGSAATQAIAGAKGSITLLLPIVSALCKMVAMDNGKFGVRVIDAMGEERLSPASGSTEHMTIKELVGELKNDERFARAFDGVESGGSGAAGGQQGSGSTPGGTVGISPIDAKNPQKYRAARDKAQKAGKQLVIKEG